MHGAQSDDTEAAFELAVRIQALLDAYIRIHNDLLKFSVRRLIPIPGIFEPIDHAGNGVRLRQIGEQLTECIEEVCERSASSPMGPGVVEFIAALGEYALVLRKTVLALADICECLQLKAQHPGRYTLAEYQRDMDAYKALVTEYRLLGAGVNVLFRRL